MSFLPSVKPAATKAPKPIRSKAAELGSGVCVVVVTSTSSSKTVSVGEKPAAVMEMMGKERSVMVIVVPVWLEARRVPSKQGFPQPVADPQIS
jgi:hypothetical protein